MGWFRKSRRSDRRLSFLRLEAREVLAGSLIASQTGGAVTIVGTDAAESFQIQAQTRSGSFKIVGADGTTVNGAAESTFSGVTSLAFDLRGGDDRGSLDASIRPSFNLAGSLAIDGGEGDNSFGMGGLFSPSSEIVRIGGDLSVSGESGDNTVMIAAGGGTVVQGNANFAFGNGDVNLTANGLTVRGASGLSVSAAQGEDTIRLGGLAVNGDVMLALGGGGADVTINGSTGIFGPKKDGSIGGDLTIDVDGDGSLRVDDNLTVKGAFMADLGDFGGVSLGSGRVRFNTIDVTAENLGVSSGATLRALGDVAFTGLRGAVVDLSEGAAIGGDLAFHGGRGGFGNRFAVDAFSETPLRVTGDATFVTSGGFNEITIQSSGQRQSSIGGRLSVVGGAGVEIVTLDNLRVIGDAGFELSSGRNNLSLGQGIGPVAVGQNLTIRTGDGRDNVQFLNATVSMDTSIELGDGADSVSIGDSSFRRFELFAGLGVDSLNIEPPFFGSERMTSFAGTVLVELAAGNDSLRIGDVEDSQRVVRFAADAVFDGGAGLDDFDELRANFIGMPQFESFEDLG